MGRCIARFKDNERDLFCEWSTVVDAPVTELMSEEEMTEFLNRRDTCEYDGCTCHIEGNRKRIERARQQGTSFIGSNTTIEGLIEVNRAGKNERKLSYKQIVKAYKPKLDHLTIPPHL